MFLLLGQANMAGRGEMVPGDKDTIDENLYLLDSNGEIELATNPLNRYSTIKKEGAKQGIGPGHSFGKMIARATGRKVLLVDVCVCVVFAAGCCVFCLAVLDEEVEVVTDFTVFCMSLSVKHIRLCYSKVLFSHETDFYLILDFLHVHSFCDAYMGEDVYEILFCGEASY